MSARILRYYESQGLILSQRLANGYRDYPLQTVDIVRQIKDLIECGFSTRQIGAFLQSSGSENSDPRKGAADLAPHIEKLHELDGLIDVLTERRRRLSERIALFGHRAVTSVK
ncbi:merR regulatory family protein [Collimonas pratensis]|uniref:MerR regulatory family protein n=1 Tax=Collimonas pratensis TaxID=279113 RepID=A0ABM5Z6T4_9BURK|nr:merR regulatory family protein [Collimonas pratensis]